MRLTHLVRDSFNKCGRGDSVNILSISIQAIGLVLLGIIVGIAVGV